MRLLRCLTFVLFAGLALTPIHALAQQQQQQAQKITITKCQACQNKAADSFKNCQASGGGASCTAPYQKKMAHCNKKWCSPKTTKVTVKRPS